MIENLLKEIIKQLILTDREKVDKIISDYMNSDEFKKMVIDRAQFEVEDILQCNDEFERGVIELSLKNISNQLK